MELCEFPGCSNEATEQIGDVQFCKDHEVWALQVLDDREYKDFLGL